MKTAVLTDNTVILNEAREAVNACAERLDALFGCPVTVSLNSDGGYVSVRDGDDALVGISIRAYNKEFEEYLNSSTDAFFSVTAGERMRLKKAFSAIDYCTTVNTKKTVNICKDGKFIVDDCYNRFDTPEEAVEYLKNHVFALKK